MPRHTTAAIVFLAAIIAYWNTLTAQFTFDDSFAVISNGDVTRDDISVADLLRHDFWGQDIVSGQSHKSYRPLTVFLFRLTRQSFGWVKALVPSLAKSLPNPYKDHPWTEGGGASNSEVKQYDEGLPRGVHPLPFHLINILLHGLVSVEVLWLARFLISLRRGTPYSWASAESQTEGAGEEPVTGHRRRDSGSQRQDGRSGSGGGGSTAQPPGNSSTALRRRAVKAGGAAGPLGRSSEPQRSANGSSGSPRVGAHGAGAGDGGLFDKGEDAAEARRVEVEALAVALLFALHPVHCEAVAGVVGQAELLSAALSLPALMLYFRVAFTGMEMEEGLHWRLVGAAVALSLSAAFAKEIGITVLGSMAAMDLLMVPLTAAAAAGTGGGAGALASGSSSEGGGGRRWRVLLRAALSLGCAISYVKLRSWVAGDHLVRIYRKVENPIPFMDSFLERVLAVAHLHAQYFWLLLWPRQLSADWSYACVVPVTELSDPRNAMAAALYGYLLLLLVAARPFDRLWQLLGLKPPSDDGAGTALWTRRWRLYVLGALLVCPFVPAANIFFYVGTYIGERLLYFPSLGFSLLVAEGLGALADATPRAWARGAARVTVLALLALVLGCYAVRTVTRNNDWRTEEQLFISAQKVCNNSAKVQLNSGILERRRQNFTAALSHFRRARELEPGYCEPDYWEGLSIINSGGPSMQDGVLLLKRALRCKYVAVDTLAVLNLIFRHLQQGSPADAAMSLQVWGGILLDPPLLRVEEGCSAMEDAALMMSVLRRPAVSVKEALSHCLSRIDMLLAAPGGPEAAAQALVPPDLQFLAAKARDAARYRTLHDCVLARQRVYLVLTKHPPNSTTGKRAIYRYVEQSGSAPLCRAPPADILAALPAGEPMPPTSHMKLINVFQSADSEDPWLQMEWALSLRAADLQGLRAAEARLHLKVAMQLMLKEIDALPAWARGESNEKGPVDRVGDADVYTALLEGVLSATDALQDDNSLSPAERCDVMMRQCHAAARLQAHMQRRVTDPSHSGSEGGQELIRVMLNATDRAQQCMTALRSSSVCNRRQLQQLEELIASSGAAAPGRAQKKQVKKKKKGKG